MLDRGFVMGSSDVLWLLLISGGTVALLAGRSVQEAAEPLTVRSVLLGLEDAEKSNASFSVERSTRIRGIHSEVTGDVVILKGFHMALAYMKEGTGPESHEVVNVALDDRWGTLLIEFRGGIVQGLHCAGETFDENTLPRSARGTLGSILRIARMFVREHADG
jgi:hypothetical protein